MSHTQQFAVFVPANAAGPIAQIIVRGSALVGTATGGELVTVDFEGNIYGASNIRTFADRARHAADRQSVLYPTIARRTIPRSDLRQVAWFDPDTGITLLDDDDAQKALASWLGVEIIDPSDLHFSN